MSNKNGGPAGMTRFPIYTGTSEIDLLKLRVLELEKQVNFINQLILKNIPQTKKKK